MIPPSDGYDLDFLHNFILLFPLSPVASLISGFLKYFGFPGPNAEEEEKARRAKRRAETKAREASSKKDPKGTAQRDVEDDAEDLARRQSDRDKDPFALLLVSSPALLRYDCQSYCLFRAASKDVPNWLSPIELLPRLTSGRLTMQVP